MLRALPLALLFACDAAFDLEHVRDLEHVGDLPDAADAPACVPSTARTHDPFDSQILCPWGVINQTSVKETIANSMIEIEPLASDGYLDCTEKDPAAPLPADGIFVHADHVGGDAWFGFGIEGDFLDVYVGYGVLKLSSEGVNYDTRPYDESTMKWWKIRPDAMSGMFVAELSTDGISWTKIGESSLVPIDTPVKLLFGGGLGDSAVGAINRFAGINVCD